MFDDYRIWIQHFRSSFVSYPHNKHCSIFVMMNVPVLVIFYSDLTRIPLLQILRLQIHERKIDLAKRTVEITTERSSMVFRFNFPFFLQVEGSEILYWSAPLCSDRLYSYHSKAKQYDCLNHPNPCCTNSDPP